MAPSARETPLTRRDRLTFLFGPGTRIVEQRYSKLFAARLAVLEVPRGADIRRCLVSITYDGLVTQQSAMSVARPGSLVFDYEKAMALAFLAVPRLRTALLLGLGGGAMLRYLAAAHPECEPTVVERDPTVVAFARRHFHIERAVELADAADFLAAPGRRFDVILVDLYEGGGFAAPPLSFWEDCLAALEPSGCLAVNWADGRHKAVYRPHVERVRQLVRGSLFLAVRGFKDNVVQLAATDPALDAAALRERAARAAKRQRRKSILERCAIHGDLP